MENVEPKEWDQTIEVNINGMFLKISPHWYLMKYLENILNYKGNPYILSVQNPIDYWTPKSEFFRKSLK